MVLGVMMVRRFTFSVFVVLVIAGIQFSCFAEEDDIRIIQARILDDGVSLLRIDAHNGNAICSFSPDSGHLRILIQSTREHMVSIVRGSTLQHLYWDLLHWPVRTEVSAFRLSDDLSVPVWVEQALERPASTRSDEDAIEGYVVHAVFPEENVVFVEHWAASRETLGDSDSQLIGGNGRKARNEYLFLDGTSMEVLGACVKPSNVGIAFDQISRVLDCKPPGFVAVEKNYETNSKELVFFDLTSYTKTDSVALALSGKFRGFGTCGDSDALLFWESFEEEGRFVVSRCRLKDTGGSVQIAVSEVLTTDLDSEGEWPLWYQASCRTVSWYRASAEEIVMVKLGENDDDHMRTQLDIGKIDGFAFRDDVSTLLTWRGGTLQAFSVSLPNIEKKSDAEFRADMLARTGPLLRIEKGGLSLNHGEN